jgi:hypothetical protein
MIQHASNCEALFLLPWNSRGRIGGGPLNPLGDQPLRGGHLDHQRKVGYGKGSARNGVPGDPHSDNWGWIKTYAFSVDYAR